MIIRPPAGWATPIVGLHPGIHQILDGVGKLIDQGVFE